MTPIPFDLPTRRTLPPTVAYAAGLVCELRPDLADMVREAVLNETVTIGCDTAIIGLNRLCFVCDQSQDQIGLFACERLCEIVFDGINAPLSFHRLADVLGLIPRRSAEMQITRPNRFTARFFKGKEHVGDPTIGDIIQWGFEGPCVIGLGRPRFAGMADARDASDLFEDYLRAGWGIAWRRATLPGEHEALRRLIPLHAHTVSLDPAVRAAWAKAHLDALA